MPELEDYGIDRATLERMYEEFRGGATKSDLERRYLDKPESHGKLFSGLVRRYLGIETEKRSPLAKENDRLRALLRQHGIDHRRTPAEVNRLRQADTESELEFFGYADYPIEELVRRAEQIAVEVGRSLRRSGATVDATIEVRARAASLQPEAQGAIVAACYELGFSTAAFESSG